MTLMPLVKGAFHFLVFITGSAAVFLLALFVGFTVWEASTGIHEEYTSPDGGYHAYLRVHATDRGDQVAVALRPRFNPLRHTVYRATTKVHRADTQVSLHWTGPRALTIDCTRCENFKVLENQNAWRGIRITLIPKP